MTRAGHPTAIAKAGISWVTTAFAPITAPLPIETPANIFAPDPIQQSSPIVTFFYARSLIFDQIITSYRMIIVCDLHKWTNQCITSNIACIFY